VDLNRPIDVNISSIYIIMAGNTCRDCRHLLRSGDLYLKQNRTLDQFDLALDERCYVCYHLHRDLLTSELAMQEWEKCRKRSARDTVLEFKCYFSNTRDSDLRIIALNKAVNGNDGCIPEYFILAIKAENEGVFFKLVSSYRFP